MPEFIPFRFEVNLYAESRDQILCRGMFSEVSGLELTMEPRTIAVGGENWGERQRVGPTRFSPIVLKRGVTNVKDLWAWFDATTRGANYGYRLQGEIKVLGNRSDSDSEYPVMMLWKLSRVLPTRFKGPDLNAIADQVAIEELTLVCEELKLEAPETV